MDTPSQSQINDAKKYLRQRLSAESSSAKNLHTQLLLFANKLLALYRKYKVTPNSLEANSNPLLQAEIQILLNQLEDELYEETELLSVAANKDDKAYIIALINEEAYGNTLKSRITHYSEQIKESIDNIIKERDWANIALATAVFSSLPNKINPFYALERLLKHTIATAWMNDLKHVNENAKGFYAKRGSSYPCPICDDYAGYHPIEEYELPLHPNCCCYPVFVY